MTLKLARRFASMKIHILYSKLSNRWVFFQDKNKQKKKKIFMNVYVKNIKKTIKPK